ncbi:peroxiredoxin-like 2A [Dendrobates tinctorius]|uniref:peroxiredoxin-like 2A n=1 Tax=Dendrobates tinctorius TaxID=92724 RepID=UPI003CC95640
MWGVPESEIYAMAMWSISVGALGAAVIGIIFANTDYFLPTTDKATLEYLEDTDLKPISDDSRTLKAKELWERNGAVIMAVRRPGCFLCREEASEISQLKPELDKLGIPLYGVVKEKIGTEIDDFQPYFKGDLFLDIKKRFYGPQKRKMMLLGFIRLGVWQNFRRAWKAGFEGNLEGEGLILGGVFVVGSGKQGILLEHREKEFGDKANLTAVLEAAKKINRNTEVH